MKISECLPYIEIYHKTCWQVHPTMNVKRHTELCGTIKNLSKLSCLQIVVKRDKLLSLINYSCERDKSSEESNDLRLLKMYSLNT